MKDAVEVEASDGNLACWIYMGLSALLDIHNIIFFIFPNPNSSIVAFFPR